MLIPFIIVLSTSFGFCINWTIFWGLLQFRAGPLMLFKFLNYIKLLRFLLRHMIVTSEALGRCERLAQGRYSVMQRPGVERATCWLQVQHLKLYTETLPRLSKENLWGMPRQFFCGLYTLLVSNQQCQSTEKLNYIPVVIIRLTLSVLFVVEKHMLDVVTSTASLCFT